MKCPPSRSLLWIDDDAPDRFEFEGLLLTQQGWTITWAKSAEKGAELLQNQAFKAVILDQMLPWSKLNPGIEAEEVWAGCFLLFWLRGKGRPSKAPPREAFDRLFLMQPLESNRGIPVVLGSAYFDEEIWASVSEIEPQIAELPKPIDEFRLIELFTKIP